MVTTKRLFSLIVFCFGLSGYAVASEQAGTIKTAKGSVNITRGGESIGAEVGTAVFPGDAVVTGSKSFAGMTMRDNTRLTAGPDSKVVIDQFQFDIKTHEGRMTTSLGRGSLSVISGQLAKANPEAVSFKTSSMTLGVRGTEFIIEATE